MKYIKTYENLEEKDRQLDWVDLKLSDDTDVKTISQWEIYDKYGENTDDFLTFLLQDKNIFFYSKKLGERAELVRGKVYYIHMSKRGDDIFYAVIDKGDRTTDTPIYSKIFTQDEINYEEAEMKMQAKKYNL